MSLFSADVTLSDPSAPTITEPSGALWHSAAFHRGTETASFGGTDNTGILEADVVVDGLQRTIDRGSCDFSRPIPCPATAAPTPHTLDTRTLRDGSHQLQAVVKDAAGNPATAGPIAIAIDNTAPGPPEGLAVAPHGDGTYDTTWTNPTGQVAPITVAHFQLCPSGGGPCGAEQTSSHENVSSLNGLRPGPGAWNLRLWLEDAAGNAGNANAAAKLDRHQRLTVRGQAAGDLSDKIDIRYRYRARRHLRSLTKRAGVHHGRFVAHLKLPVAARRARKGTLTASYPGDTGHDAAKVNQRLKLSRGR
jgi:hypothetical protein